MKNSKKLVNLISLVVLVTTNILSPLSYATAGEEDIGSVSDTVSYLAEGGSGGESYEDSDEYIDDNESSMDSDVADTQQSGVNSQNNDNDSSRADEEENEGVSNDTETPMDFSDTPQNDGDIQEGVMETDSQLNNQDDENTQHFSADASEGQTGESSDSDEEATQNDESADNDNEEVSDIISDTIDEIINRVKFFFKKIGLTKYIEYDEDENDIGIITLTDPDTLETITIMDRNLGAEMSGTGEESYGLYFQWGNNHGVEEVNSTNKTTTKAEYNDSYYLKGYDGNGLFIVGDNDYRENGKHYNYLWGTDKKEKTRQASCPAGYHIPTIKEWNELMSIWGKIHTQDTVETEEGNTVSKTRFTANSSQNDIVSFKDSAQECVEGDSECVTEDDFSEIISVLSSELKLPLAGGYGKNGKYYDEVGVYWTSISRDGDKALVFNIDTYFSQNDDEELRYKAQGHSIRCFQNVEDDIQDTQSEEDTQEGETTNDSSYEASEGQDVGGLTGDVVELTDADLELATAWETLNVDSITKSDKYNKVTVNVEAPTGTFPEGTYANIRPIVSTTKLDEIKGQISEEDKTVSQESEVVAFDIKFLYKLSDGTEIEVQPKENTVKVTFNYEDNKELSKVDENDNQEVKIFHLDNKDENGEVVDRGEEKVVEVTNKAESTEDGIAVADAESFSIYAIIISNQSGNITMKYIANKDTAGCQGSGGTFSGGDTYLDVIYTKNASGLYVANINVQAPNRPMVNGTGWMFDGWYKDDSCTQEWYGVVDDTTEQNIPTEVYAKFIEFRDLNVKVGKDSSYTIMDRNLGATAVATGIFEYNSNGVTRLDSSDTFGKYYQWGNNYGFNNIPYTNRHSEKVDTTPYGPGNYYSSATAGKDIRYPGPYNWDLNDNYDLWGGITDSAGNNPAARQGPCPAGYHVPSQGEWNALRSDNMRSKLKLPHAGGSDSCASGRYGCYWTSSASDKGRAAYLNLAYGAEYRPVSPYVTDGTRDSLMRVRCFKNIANKVVTFETNCGSEVEDQWVEPGGTIIEPEVITRGGGWIFDGWYLSGEEQSFNFTDTITENIVLYAKWRSDGTVAMLTEGTDFNAKIKNLANNSTNLTYTSTDNNIEKIERSETPAPEGVRTEIISSPESLEIEAWYDGSGTIKYYTQASTIYMNENSSNIFRDCSSLEDVDLSGWNTSNVKNMSYMFNNCSSLTNLDLSSWNTSNVTDMTYMFYNCSNLKTIYASILFSGGSNNGGNMFSSDTKIVGGNGTKYNSSYTNLVYAKVDKQGQKGYFTDKSMITVRYMVGNTEYLTGVVSYGDKISSPANPMENFIGWYYEGLTEPFDFENSITEYTELYAKGGTEAILMTGQNFNAKIKNLANNSTNLTYTSTDNNIEKIERSDTPAPEGVRTEMISSETSLLEIVAWYDGSGTIKYYTPASTIYMNPDSSYMFNKCSSLEDVDLSSWNTSNVKNMSYMFNNCSSLTNLDLSSWNTSNVTNMYYMFYGCSNLKTIYASTSFNTNNVTNGSYMFSSDTKIVGGNGTKYNNSYTSNTYARPDVEGQIGYFTNKSAITVKFIVGDMVYSSGVVSYGGTVTIPIDPEMEGYEFSSRWGLSGSETDFNFTTDTITEYTELYPIYSCAPGYMMKGDACVESVIVSFDTNEGLDKESIEIEKGTKLKAGGTKYSHTSNISDAGERSGNYSNSLSTTDTVTIPGVESLHVELRYGTESCCDYVSVYKGTTTSSLINTYKGGTTSPTTVNFDVEGDSVTFKFYSDTSVNGYYGYYAIVQGLVDNIGENPTRDGYTFAGWYTQGGELFDLENTSIDENITLYAHWTPNIYTVTFIENTMDDVDPEPSSKQVTYDSAYGDLPVLEKEGYHFDGWYDGESLVTSGTIFNHTGDITLTAKWGMGTIDFDSNGGNLIDPITDFIGTIINLPGVTHTGNIAKLFEGWFRDGINVGGSGDSYTITGNAVLVAGWSHTVTFNLGGGNCTDNECDSQEIFSGNTATQPTNNPTREGYQFSGWFDSAEGGNEFNFSNPITADTTVYAYWDVNCPDGEEYVGSKGKCYPSRAIIRDSESGEIIQINDMEWNDLELYFLSGDGTTVSHFTIMDRNLGATEVYNQNWSGQNTDSFGYVYQWGNNYGFTSTATWKLSEGTTSTISNATWGKYVPSQYGRNRWSTAQNWMVGSSKTDGIWGGTGDTTTANGEGTTKSGRQGPCPEGYYIPSTLDWNTMYEAWYESKSSTSNIGQQISSDWLMPAAGLRYYDKTVNGVGSIGYYWSSSPYDANNARILYFYSPNISPQNYGGRSNGFSVRCFKNSPSSTFTLHANGGTGAVIAFTGTVGDGKFTTLGTPTRSNSTFSGWYDAEVGGNKIETGSTVVSNIYARWNCASGYTDNGTACVQGVKVTLDANTHGGTIDSAGTKEITVANGGNLNLSSYTGYKEGWNFVGWSENNTSTGAVSNLENITSAKTLYAVFSKTLTGTFNKDDSTVSSISNTTATCTLRNTASNCTLTAPTITCEAGYSNGAWSPSSMTITQNANFTASCSDTQAPNISITKQPSVSCVSSDGVRANITDNVGVTSMKYGIIGSSSCNSGTVATWNDYENGSTIPFSSEESNGKYVCFKASDAANNTSYQITNQITNIDIQGPGVPTLGSPANDIYTNDNTPTFSWNAGDIAGCATLSGYTIQICSDGSCNNVIQTSSSTTASFTPNTALIDGTYYWRVKETDSLNRDSDFTTSRILKIDTTAPVLSDKTTFENIWYTTNQISEFMYTDTGAGINGTNKITCEISQEGNASKCTITNVEICDNVGNCNREDQTSNPIKLDRTQPVCGTWTYSPTSQTNNNVTATLAGSTDATSGIKTSGGTCSLSSNDATCNVTIEDNAGLTRVCTSASVYNIDKVKPEGEIQAVTSTLKSTTQEVKLICSDNVGVSSYYWGTNSNPASTDYQNITSQTNYEITETVNAAGTYYLFCRDEAENISNSKSQIYNSYEVHNMLNKVDKDESTYNATNYTQTGSTVTYIAPAGTTITFADVYTVPTYSSANMYKGYTTVNSGTPSTNSSTTLNSNSTYYFWFDRTKYDLNLVKNNGIETIYYRVNGATSYSNTSDSKSVQIKAGSDVYVYAVAKSGYTYTQTNETNLQLFTSVIENKTFSPTTSLQEYTITYNNLKGVHNPNPTTFTVETPTISLTNLTKNGYAFDGWYDAEINGTKVTQILQGTHDNVILYAKWLDDINHNGIDDSTEPRFKVVFSGGEVGVLSGRLEYENVLVGLTFQEAGIVVPEILSKSGYVSKGWSPRIPQLSDIVGNNITYSVIWKIDENNNGIADEEEQSPTPSGGGSSGGGGGGGGGGIKWNPKTQEKDIHGSADVNVDPIGDEGEKSEDTNSQDFNSSTNNVDGQNKSDSSESNKNNSSQNNPTYSEEFNQAYSFAYSKGITTVPTIEAANLNSALTRIQMAKMLSYFAINVLGKKPDTTKKVKFRDVSVAKNKQYDNGVTLAYQLGIMGINMKNDKFRPNDLVTRAEFVTALSRLLYNTDDGEYKGTSKYYKPHMDSLYNEGIITKTNPKMEENRGYVMIMLMRTVK